MASMEAKDYLETQGVQAALHDAVKTVLLERPENAVARVGQLLVEASGPKKTKADVVKSFAKSAWDGTYKADVTADATFVQGGMEMPVDNFFGWCTAVGMAGAFPAWAWTNASLEELPDGRIKLGSQQTSGKMAADIPAIGPFPEVKLSEVPSDSLLLTDTGAVLPVEIGYYSFNDEMKVTKIDYAGELANESASNTMSFTPPVGPPLLYALAGKPLPPPPAPA